MIRLLYGLLFVGFLAATVPAADVETVTLEDYKPKVGDRTRHTDEERTATRTVTVRDGKREDKVEKKSKVVSYVSETLAVKGGEKKPVRMQRIYEKAEETTEDGTEKLPLHGKTVIIERQDGKYKFTDGDGKKLPEAAEKVLQKEFEKKKSDAAFDKLLPRRALKPGETWKLELDEIAKEMATDTFTVDAKRLAGTGTLARAYKFGGRTYGEFDLTFTIPLTEMSGAVAVKLKSGSAMKMSMHAEGNTDGTEPDGVAVLRMSMVIVFDVPDGEISIRSDSLMSMATEALPPRKRD